MQIVWQKWAACLVIQATLTVTRPLCKLTTQSTTQRSTNLSQSPTSVVSWTDSQACIQAQSTTVIAMTGLSGHCHWLQMAIVTGYKWPLPSVYYKWPLPSVYHKMAIVLIMCGIEIQTRTNKEIDVLPLALQSEARVLK